MKNKALIIIVFFIVVVVHAKIVFTVPSTVVTKDNRFSLKDIFQNIQYDRTISYINHCKKYTMNDLKKVLSGFLSIYYKDYELIFKSDVITVIYEKSNNNMQIHFDVNNFLLKIIKDYDKELKVVKIDDRITVDTTPTITKIFRSGNTLYISAFYLKNGIKKYFNIPVKVAKEKKILVFSKSILRNTVLTSKDTKESTVNILSLNFPPLFLNEFKEGKFKVIKNVKKNEIINKNYLRTMPDVRAGSIIMIKVLYKGIIVKTWGVVLKDANYEEVIRVKNSQTNKIITGVLKTGPYLLVELGSD